MTDPNQITPKKHGCFFYGCITSLVVLLLAGVSIFFIARYAMHQINAMVVQNTATSPMAVETVDLPPAELKALQARVEAFTTAMKAHAHPAPLVLTGPEVTTLLTSNPQMQPFRNGISIAFNGDEIDAQLSLPLDAVAAKLPALKTFDVAGRYLNGNGTFKASISDGKLFVFVQSLTVKGRPIPENILSVLQQQNLANGFNQSANPSPFAQYESIEVTNSTAIVTPKQN